MKIKDVTNSQKDWDDFWYHSTDKISVSEYQKKAYDETISISELESLADDPMGIGK